MKQPLFEITDSVPLDELGYDKGSEAVVVINATREWETAWSRIFDMTRDVAGGETVTDFDIRYVEAQFPLAATMIKRVTLNGKTWDTVTPEILQEIDNLDPMIMSVVMRERNERNAARVVNASVTFRESRKRALQGRQENQDKAASGSNLPVVGDKAGQ